MDQSRPSVYRVPGTDFAVIVATWEQATHRLPAGTTVLQGGIEAVHYRTALDKACADLAAEGYTKVARSVFSDGRDTVTLCRIPRPAPKPVETGELVTA